MEPQNLIGASRPLHPNPNASTSNDKTQSFSHVAQNLTPKANNKPANNRFTEYFGDISNIDTNEPITIIPATPTNQQPLPPMHLSRLAMNFPPGVNPQLGYLRVGYNNRDGHANVLEDFDFGQDMKHNTLIPAINEVKTRERKIDVYMSQLTGTANGAAAAGIPNAAPPDLELKPIDYADIDKRAAALLKKQLTAAGVKIPSSANSRFSTYAEDEHRNSNVSDQHRQRKIRKDDPALRSSGVLNRLYHRIDESRLMHSKTLHQFAYQKVLRDASILSQLYEPNPTNRKDVRLRIRTIPALNAFFAQHFGITLPRSRTTVSQNNLALAQTPHQQETVLDLHLDHLLARLPLAHGLTPDDTSGGLKGLAVTHAQESLDQARFSARNIQRFVLEDGTYCQKDPANPANFTLVRPFPFSLNDGVRYESGTLRFRQRANGTYHIEMWGIDQQNGVAHAIPLRDNTGADIAWQQLRRCFNIDSVLTPLFGDGTQLRREGFDALFGKRMAQKTLEDKALDFVSQPYKRVFDAAMENCVSLIGSGYSFNPSGGSTRGGHWGTNFANDSRARFMRHVFDRAQNEHRMSAGGSCGTQQDAIMYAGGHITTVVDLTGKTYLASLHGNDKEAVDEKNTFSEIEPFNAVAGNYEQPIDTRDVPALRGATQGKPVSQTKAFPLVGQIDINNGYWVPAEKQNVYETREMAPLSVSIATHAKAPDKDLGIRNDEETNAVTLEPIMIEYGGKPVMSNSRFVETTALRLDELVPKASDDSKGKNKEASRTTQEIELEVARQLAEVRAGKRTELDVGDLVFRHELPPGTALADDQGNFIRDDDGKLVTVRETVTVRPRIVRRTVTEPRTETYGKDIDGKPKSRFAAAQRDPLNPGRWKVPTRTREIIDVKFDIVEIDRWRRMGMRNPHAREEGAGEFLLDKDENVLCEFQRIKHRFIAEGENPAGPGDRKFSPADQEKLHDMVYAHINCVHSHNGLNVAYEQDLMRNNVRIVGHAIDPNDKPFGAAYAPVISPGNPLPHPAAVDRLKPAASHISEHVTIEAGSIAAVVTSQPHSDALKKEGGAGLDPYGAEEYGPVDPKYYGHRNGNTNIVQTGLNIAYVDRQLLAEQATKSGQWAANFTFQQNLLASQHFTRQKAAFDTLSAAPTDANLEALRNGLLPANNAHHPLWTRAMDRLTTALEAANSDKGLETLGAFKDKLQDLRDLVADLDLPPGVASKDKQSPDDYRQEALRQIDLALKTLNSGMPPPVGRARTSVERAIEALENAGAKPELQKLADLCLQYAAQVDYPNAVFKETQALFVAINSSYLPDSKVDPRPNLQPSAFSPNAKARNDALYNKHRAGDAKDEYEAFVDERATTTSEVRHRGYRAYDENDAAPAPFNPGDLAVNWAEEDSEKLGKAFLNLLGKIDAGTPQERAAALAELAGSRLFAHWEGTPEEKIGEVRKIVDSPIMVELHDTLDGIENLAAGIAITMKVLPQRDAPNGRAADGGTGDGAPTLGGTTLRSFNRPNNNGAWQVANGLAAKVGDDTVAASIGDILHSAHVLTGSATTAVLGTLAAVSTSTSLLLFALAAASAKDGKAAIGRLKSHLDQYRAYQGELGQAKNELDAIAKELKANDLLPKLEEAGLDPKEAAGLKQLAQTMFDKLDATIEKHDKALADRIAIMEKQLGEQIFGTATNVSAFAADGALVTAEAALSLTPGMHAIGGLCGVIGSGVLALYGLARLGLTLWRAREIASLTHEKVQQDFCADSGLGNRLLEAVKQKKTQLTIEGVIWSLNVLGNGMIIAAPFSGPAAPILGAVGAVIVVTTTGAAFVPPFRQTRGRTARAGMDTAHIQGSFLNDNARRNRLVHHEGSILALQSGEIHRMVEAMSPPRYDAPRRKQFRFQFEQLRGARWIIPNADRKLLAQQIKAHFEETKEHQFNFMLRVTQHEENHWLYRVGELSKDLIDLDVQMAAITVATLRDISKTTGDGKSALETRRDKILEELTAATSRRQALTHLREALQEFSADIGTDWSAQMNKFEDLQVRYLLAHDRLVDAMSRDDMKKLLAAPDKPASMVATMRQKTRLLGALPAKQTLANLTYQYNDTTVAFVKAQLGRIRDRFVDVMVYATEDLAKTEIQAVTNQAEQAKLRQLKEETSKTGKSNATPFPIPKDNNFKDDFFEGGKSGEFNYFDDDDKDNDNFIDDDGSGVRGRNETYKYVDHFDDDDDSNNSGDIPNSGVVLNGILDKTPFSPEDYDDKGLLKAGPTPKNPIRFTDTVTIFEKNTDGSRTIRETAMRKPDFATGNVNRDKASVESNASQQKPLPQLRRKPAMSFGQLGAELQRHDGPASRAANGTGANATEGDIDAADAILQSPIR